MALWPFKRRGSRKRPRTNTSKSLAESSGRGRPGEEPLPQRTQTEPVADSTPTSTVNARKEEDEPKKLQRRARTYSFSPGRSDAIRVAKAREEDIPPLPSGPLPDALIGDDYGDNGGPYRVPTLHHNNSRNKRRAQPLPRKKSSKRRKEDHDRELQLKALSQAQPVRPATDDLTSGRPMKRESRRVKSGQSKERNSPASDVSLPIPESIHSSMSTDSEHVAYKVSALDSLAPRPTIKYSYNPIYGPASRSAPVRSSSQRGKLSEPIPEATLKAHKRIDDLADDFDASDLRELMERDKRRRERKKEKERERMERRLTRRAEKQREDAATAASEGSPPPQNLERGVLGRETVGLGIDSTSAVVTSSRRRPSVESLPDHTKEQSAEQGSELPRRTPSPLDKFYEPGNVPPEPPAEDELDETEEVQELDTVPRSPRSPSPKLVGFLRSNLSRSKSPKTDASKEIADAESVGRLSESPSRAWPSFLRWGSKAKRNSGPSSFSNTSRDSMLASQPPPPPSNYIPPRRLSSGVPKRTMSRFREDLPELPMSPPDSRVASPEAEPLPSEPIPIINNNTLARHDTPLSGRPSREAEEMRGTPTSMHRDEIDPSPAPHSMSLASVDSEASWLSGKLGRKRASSGMRGSLASYPMRSASRASEEPEDRDDDEDLAHDEYLSSLDNRRLQRKSAGDLGEARPSSDAGDERSPKWGALGQTATLMHNRDTIRSREGLLLQSWSDDEKRSSGSQDPDSPDSPVVPQRATSVNLGKGHVRNFSAGSAKLLDLPPRSSGEKRRSGTESIDL